MRYSFFSCHFFDVQIQMCVTFYYDSVHAIVTVNCSLFPQFTHHFSKRGCDLNVSSKECHGRARSRSRSAAGSEVVHTPEHGVFVGPPRLVAETSEYDTLLSQPEKQKRKPDNAKAQRGGKKWNCAKKTRFEAKMIQRINRIS